MESGGLGFVKYWTKRDASNIVCNSKFQDVFTYSQRVHSPPDSRHAFQNHSVYVRTCSNNACRATVWIKFHDNVFWMERRKRPGNGGNELSTNCRMTVRRTREVGLHYRIVHDFRTVIQALSLRSYRWRNSTGPEQVEFRVRCDVEEETRSLGFQDRNFIQTLGKTDPWTFVRWSRLVGSFEKLYFLQEAFTVATCKRCL